MHGTELTFFFFWQKVSSNLFEWEKKYKALLMSQKNKFEIYLKHSQIIPIICKPELRSRQRKIKLQFYTLSSFVLLGWFQFANRQNETNSFNKCHFANPYRNYHTKYKTFPFMSQKSQDICFTCGKFYFYILLV